mgnify:CR=1 FL=1
MNPSFDLVYHLAGLSRIQPSFESPSETFNVNTMGTQRVLEFARRHDLKVIYAGSSSKHHDPYQSPYAACKLYRPVRCSCSLYRVEVRVYRLHAPATRS